MGRVSDEITKCLINWREKLGEDEWFFQKLREKVVEEMQPFEAFDAIPEVIDLLLAESDGYLGSEIFDLLFAIIIKSDTTEVHPSILRRMKEIESKIGGHDSEKTNLGKLKRWYRLK